MTLTERLRRVPAWGWALSFAVVIGLVRLGSSGFWDPWELKVADQAREMARGHLFDSTAGGKALQGPILTRFLEALGIALFGAHELGARLFIGLSAVGAVMAVYWAGAGLFRRRSALLAALALGSMNVFVLEARQLISDMPLIAGQALALGGLGRWAWPADGRRRPRDLAVALVGLVIGLLGGGPVIGVTLPLAALAGALLVGFRLTPPAEGAEPAPASDDAEPVPTMVTSPGAGPDVPAGTAIGPSLLQPSKRGFVPLVLLLAAGTLLFVLAVASNTVGKYNPWLGVIPRGGVPDKMFEALIQQLGFGLFPWSALAVFALGRPLIRLDDDSVRGGGRLVFGQLLLFLAAGFGFALSTYQMLVAGDARYVALAPIALAIGAFLDEALEGLRPEPVLGLLVGAGTLVVARDFFLTPEELISVHLGAKAKWPPTVNVGYGLLVFGLLFAGTLYLGLNGRTRALGHAPPPDLSGARRWRRRLDRVIVEAGRWGVQACVASAIGFALFNTHYLIPTLSNHFSFKKVLEPFEKYAKDGAAIAKYHVEGKGAGFYGQKEMIDLPTQDAVVQYLRKPERVFVLVNADDLGSLDAAFRLGKTDYVVADATSSRFQLFSNKLAPGEQDQNPLKKWVRNEPFPPARLKASAVFDGKIELVGADYPESMRRPGKIPLKLYFKVNQRPSGSFKIFVHFDSPGQPRLIGDHDLVQKLFPTNDWLPGEYVLDEFDVDVPLMTTPAGEYTVWMGFWPGGEGKRLKITTGDQDGSDRVKLGKIDIK